MMDRPTTTVSVPDLMFALCAKPVGKVPAMGKRPTFSVMFKSETAAELEVHQKDALALALHCRPFFFRKCATQLSEECCQLKHKQHAIHGTSHDCLVLESMQVECRFS